MRKKLTAILIALTIAISLLPIPAAAAVSADEEAQIMSAVSQVVKEYAAKVYQADSADKAYTAYLKHGFYGNGAKMTLTEDSAMVAALFNACVMQDALTRSITKGIVNMQDLNETEFFLNGGPGWHNYYYSYRYTGYRGDALVYSNFLGELLTAKDIYGENRYSGPTNRNDEVMELLVGSLDCDVIIRRTESKEYTSVYTLELQISDCFDFEGDYSEISKQGFDTSTDDTLNNLGYLLTYVGLNEFDWSFQTELQVEVPICCDHSGDDSYHWTLDTDAQMLISDAADGFKSNPASRISITDSATGEVTYQYKLDETVILSHDKPWVVEYDLQPVKRLSLSALDHSDSCYPYFLQHSTTHLWVPYYEMIKLSDTKTGYRWHYMGVEMLNQFSYSSKKVYSFHVENVIDANGGNMPWVTVYNDMGETIFGPEPLNDYWTSSHEDSTRVLTQSDVTMISGTDIIINYIGSKSNRIIRDQLDLWIWENGKDNDPAASAGTYAVPTCTAEGGYYHTCADCGYTYTTEPEPALGHDFSDYIADNNMTCTTDGTETRTCSRCALTESRTVTGTALGHDFSDYIPDNNETCTTDGTKTRTCSRCGITDTVSVPDSATGHTEVEDPGTDSTCITKGITTGKHCTICGTITVPQTQRPYTDHKWDKGTVIKQPTPTTMGTLLYTCTVCGQTNYISIDSMDDINSTGFKDVPADAYYAEAVAWAKEQNITSGISDTLFGSDNSCTRGQVVTFLWRAAGSPTPISNDNPFTDVRESDYYYTAVLWAVENGITGGIGDGKFGPNNTCTRGQIVTFLYRAQNSPAAEGDNPFTDVTDSAYYCAPVLWAVENGITGGIGNSMFGPDNTCTRAQVVTFLYKTYQ